MWAAASAAAQTTRPERPYRGLFAGGVDDAEQLLTVRFSASGGYDDTLATSGSQGEVLSGPTDPREARKGSYGQAAGGVAYRLNGTRAGIGASGSTTQRRFSTVGGSVLGTYAGDVSAWFQVARRTRLTASESYSFQPFLSYGLFPQPNYAGGQPNEPVDLPRGEPVDPSAPGFDLASGSARQRRHSGSASLTQSLSPRTSVSLGAAYDNARASLDAGNVSSYSGDGRLSLQVRQGVGVHVGYGYREGQYGSQSPHAPSIARSLDVGLDYNRPLSFSRRTKFGFSTGSTSVQESTRTVYRLTGNARLSYEFQRTWNAALAYNRDAGFLQNLRRPVFADALSLSIAGQASRRVQVSTSLGAALGLVGLIDATRSNGYNTFFGTSALTFGVSRYAALDVGYSYYHYAFERGVQLPQTTGRQLNRQSVQAAVKLWLPIEHRSRRPHAAR